MVAKKKTAKKKVTRKPGPARASKKKVAKKKTTRRAPPKKPAHRPPPNDPVTGYAMSVLNKKIISGPHVRAACQRHMNDLKRDDLWFDLEAANRIIGFFPDLLILSEGQFEGQPFHLAPSQKFIIGSLFGWKKARVAKEKRPDWPRRYRRGYIEEGKGNGKSPLLGGIGLYGMIADGEDGAQIYSGAANKDQAGILFQDAVKMVAKSPLLDQIITKSGGNPVWRLTHIPSSSFFIPISREKKKVGSGPRPHFALIDELHEHPDRGILEVLEEGFKFRRQPMIVMATNSGFDKNTVCGEEHDHGVKVVNEQLQDDDTFAYICALDEKDDPLKHKRSWVKTNPLLGEVITKEYLAKRVKAARAFPTRQNRILRLNFCVWTQSETAWISREDWEAIEDATIKLEKMKDRRCWGGLDLSATTDLTSFALLFEDGETKAGQPKFIAYVHSWTPRDKLRDRVEHDRAPYDQWVKEKWIRAEKGAKIRLDFIAAECVKTRDRYDLQFIAYDKYLYKDLSDYFDAEGEAVPTLEHGQGYNRRQAETSLWMPQSIEELETLITERRIRIQPNPLMRYAISGAQLMESPAGLRRWTKAKSTSRIDPLVALTMAVGAATNTTPTNSLLNYYMNKGDGKPESMMI